MKRTLKKLFLNVTAILLAIIVTGNIIAVECAGQINSALGLATSKVVSTLPEGETEEYARYYESAYSSLADLKAAGEAKASSCSRTKTTPCLSPRAARCPSSA